MGLRARPSRSAAYAFDGHRRFRLAFVAPGNSRRAHRWASYFASRGHEVGLISLGRLTEPLSAIELLLELPAFSDERGGPARYVDLVRAAPAVRRKLRAFAPHLVNAHHLRGPAWLAYLSGTRPMIVSAWGDDVPTNRDHLVALTLDRLTLRRAACTTCDTELAAQRLAACGAPPIHIRRVCSGLHLKAGAPVAAETCGDFDQRMRRVEYLYRAVISQR
jgi:hypothetical protein